MKKGKKLTSLLAAAALAAPLTDCSLKVTKDDLTLQINPALDGKYDYATDMIPIGGQDYDKIKDSVFCIKNITTYTTTIKDSKGNTYTVKEESVVFGTGFVYQHKYGYSYLVTNDHVANSPEEAYDPFGLLYTKVATEIYIVDNLFDQNKADNLPLELIVTDPKLDIAVLKTEAELPVYPYAVGNSNELKAGNVIRMEGYPLAITKATTEGIVSNPKNDFNPAPDEFNLGNDFIIDAPTNAGNSGSPVFALRDGKFEWVGQLHAGLDAEGLKFAIAIDKFKPLLDRANEIEKSKRWHSKLLKVLKGIGDQDAKPT